jgi:PAS domain S-box-containing protein
MLKTWGAAMNDQDKTKEQLLEELATLRQRVAALEALAPRPTHHQQPGDDWWQSLLDNTPVFVAVIGRDYRIQFLNRTDSGLPPEGLIGASLADFARPEYWGEIRACVDGVFATGKADFHQSLAIRSDHESHWYEGYFGPIFKDGRVVAVSLIATNVTARRPSHQDRDSTVSGDKVTAEQMRADMARRESERRLLMLISNLPGMAYRCKIDADWTMEFVSEGCVALTGYQRSELLHNRVSSFGDLIHPQDRQMVWVGVQEALASKRHFQFEYRIRTSTGEEKWVWEQGMGVYSDSGRAEALEGFITDITERKRAEEALQEAHDELERRVEERTAELTQTNEELVVFRKFAEASGQGFGICGLDARIAYVNPALCRLFGEDNPDDLVGRSFLTYYPEEWQQRRKEEMIPALERAGHWAGEQALLSRQGQLIPTLHDVFLLLDEKGAPVCRCVVVADITERKRAEEALRHSRDELQTIYDNMVDGLLIAECATGRLLRTNPAMCRMLGYSQDELLSMSVKEIHPAEVVAAVLQKFGTQQEGQRLVTQNRPMLRRDGTVFYADIGNIRISYQGRPCVVGIFRDITERKQAQEALERERQSLWRMLQASDHERQVISYEIHDGLAQYLAAAGMQFQVFDGLRESDPAEAAKAYAAATQLVRQSHSEARRLISEVRPPVIDEIGLETAISHLVHEQRRTGGPKIKFDSEVQFGRLPSILENALYRIAQEALTNACKHSKSKTVTVTMTQEGQEVRLEVRDRGIGFDPQAVGKGHFGLEGIRQRVRLLGGRLNVESAPDSGTLVQVVVPILERHSEE